MPNPEAEDVDQPSIFINTDLLGPKSSIPIGSSLPKLRNPYSITNTTEDYTPARTSLFNKSYEVSGETFFEEESTDDRVIEFEVYQGNMDSEYDMYCSTPTSESDCEEDQPVELQVSLQTMQHGYIVNGTCYLSLHQWHTIRPSDLSDQLVQCCVCAQYCEIKASEKHVNTDTHQQALSGAPPLHSFDLSITRKIRNKYYCGVCNELFDISEENVHYSSKMHEGNLLFSINKASDLLEGYDHNKNDTYHFKNQRDNGNNGHENDNYGHENDNYGHENDNYSHFSDNNNFINFQNFYDDNEEEAPAFTGVSYANIAKTPKINVQTFIEVDLGNKKVKVRFDSWHMVISPKLNRFWCMVCKKQDHMRKKQEHCADPEHLEKLGKCYVVEAYEEYFIRQVDDKLCHCGHCNNLQLIHEMEDHVESNHPRKTKLVTDTKSIKVSPVKTSDHNSQMNHVNQTRNQSGQTKNHDGQTKNDDQTKKQDGQAKNLDNQISNKNAMNIGHENDINSNNLKNINDKNIPSPIKSNSVGHTHRFNPFNQPISPPKNINNDKKSANETKTIPDQKGLMNTSITHKMPGILDDMVIYPFGSKITVSSLAYNIVCRRPNDYYCGLCDAIVPESAICGHIYEIRHVEQLQRTPFILPFNCHLIRAIRDALHCAICNIPISADKIYLHTKDPQHNAFLAKALGQQVIGIKIPPNPISPPNCNTPNLSPNGILNIQDSRNINCTPKGIQQSNIPKSNIQTNTLPQTHIPFHSIPKLENTAQGNLQKEEKVHKTTEIEKLNENAQEEFDEEYFEEKVGEDDEIDQSLDSIGSDDASFDYEEYVYLKLKNTFIKITNTSYNTLVHIGDGSRYCFVCSIQVQYREMQRHIDCRSHLDNMEKYRFLDKYEDHLLRQIYLMYHCSICNVILTRKELKTHLEWPTHALQNDNTMKNIKKTRKTEIKGGIKQVVVSTQKENIYLQEKEAKIKVCLSVQVTEKKSATDNKSVEIGTPKDDGSRKNKIIIFKDNVLKVSWESWNGISKIKNGYKCNLCQREIKPADIDVHCASEWHRYALDKPFEKQHAPALIRKINESTLNCVICNTEVSYKEHLIAEHINGKKHLKNYETILKESSVANTYSDCNSDVLML